MRKIKVYDKDMNEKGILDSNDIEGDTSFVVTEQGYGDLDIVVIGEPNIEHSDVVKVVDVNSFIRQYYNDKYLSLDGINDYIQSGKTIVLPRRDLVGVGSFTRNSDANGYYCEGFNNVGNGTYLDLGTPYSEIDVGKAFSLKITFMVGTGTSTRHIFHHKTFKIQEIGTEIVIGFSGGASKSFTKVDNTYYRVVISYNGDAFTVYYNSTLASGSTAVSASFNSDYCIVGTGTSIGQPFTGGKFYGLCLRHVALTSGEITTENGNHLPQKSDRILGSWTVNNAFFPGSGYIKVYDQLTKNYIQDTGIVSGDLTANTNICISGRFKLGADAVDTYSSQSLVVTPWVVVHVRNTNNQIIVRYDNAGARSSFSILGNGNRTRHHFAGIVQYNGTTRQTLLFLDGSLVDSDNHAIAPALKYTDYVIVGKRDSVYYKGFIHDVRIHTFSGGFNSNDYIRLYKGLDPIHTSLITQYMRVNIYDDMYKSNKVVYPTLRSNEEVTTESQMDKHFNTSFRYTHLINIGQTSDITVKGVIMNRSSGEGAYTLTGFPSTINNNLGGGIVIGTEWSKLEEDFKYGSPTNNINLQGLTVGKRYKVVFFIGDRDGNNDPAISVRLILNGVDSGGFTRDKHRIISIEYVATSTSLDIQFNQISGGSPHFYAVINYEVLGELLLTNYGGSVITDNTAPFVYYQDVPIENCQYYGQVIGIVPFIESNNGKKTKLSFIGIQTVLNNNFFRGPNNSRTWDQLMYPNETLQWIYDQSHKYMDYKGDYNLIYTQDIGFSDSSKSSERIRSGLYMVNQSITLPDGSSGILPLLVSKGGSSFSIQNTIIVSGANANHILSFRAKSQGGNPTVTISYGILNDSFFADETFTLSSTRKRISVNVGRGSPSGTGIMWDISYNGSGNMYIYDIKCFKEIDSNIPRFSSTILNVSYSNTKLINARQDIIQYGGGKIKRTGDQYPLCFEPDLDNNPDHYLIEGKHCIYVDRGTTSDEIVNSVEVEYDGGTTSPVTDSSSISLYGKREGILEALNILDSVSAASYGNVFLSLNKNPKVYSEIVVNSSYDIGSLRVGDLVQINGNSIGIEKGYIVRLEINEDECTINIGNYNSLGKVLSSLR